MKYLINTFCCGANYIIINYVLAMMLFLMWLDAGGSGQGELACSNTGLYPVVDACKQIYTYIYTCQIYNLASNFKFSIHKKIHVEHENCIVYEFEFESHFKNRILVPFIPLYHLYHESAVTIVHIIILDDFMLTLLLDKRQKFVLGPLI